MARPKNPSTKYKATFPKKLVTLIHASMKFSNIAASGSADQLAEVVEEYKDIIQWLPIRSVAAVAMYFEVGDKKTLYNWRDQVNEEGEPRYPKWVQAMGLLTLYLEDRNTKTGETGKAAAWAIFNAQCNFGLMTPEAREKLDIKHKELGLREKALNSGMDPFGEGNLPPLVEFEEVKTEEVNQDGTEDSSTDGNQEPQEAQELAEKADSDDAGGLK